MSMVFPILDGWIGYNDGHELFVQTGTALDADHPAVRARPECFVPVEEPEPPVRRLGRPLGSKTRVRGEGLADD